MPLWITAIGIGSYGVFYGYVMFYVLKRYLPPVSQTPPALKELMFTLASLGGSGAIGAWITAVDGVNLVGPYGLGLLIGLVLNVIMSYVIYTRPQRAIKQLEKPSSPRENPKRELLVGK
jgi:hypothetical protein